LRLLASFILIFHLLIGCKNSNNESESNTTPTRKARNINFAVTNTFPHDTSLFTEGFLVHHGQLVESTGSPEDLPNTKSLVGIIDLRTGKIDEKVEIDKTKYFGEGIVFLNNKLYQLTYKTQLGFIYDAKTFKLLGEFSYPNLEGWGLTTNGTDLIMSDGTEKLTFLNAGSLKQVKTLSVTDNGSPLNRLNELEYIRGFIYANIWTTNVIVKIDPLDGKVVGKLDLTSVVNEAKFKNSNADVLNGIAYDLSANKIYVTGKLWANVYQIDFDH
jgi:glutamine cyclotransferase